MARKYAAIMALVGMSTILIRGFKDGHALEATVVSALGWMATLGVVGLIVGFVAEATVEDAVRTHMERELDATGRPARTSANA